MTMRSPIRAGRGAICRARPSESEQRVPETRVAHAHDQPKNANTWQGLFPFLKSDEDGFVGLAPSGVFLPTPMVSTT